MFRDVAKLCFCLGLFISWTLQASGVQGGKDIHSEPHRLEVAVGMRAQLCESALPAPGSLGEVGKEPQVTGQQKQHGFWHCLWLPVVSP